MYGFLIATILIQLSCANRIDEELFGSGQFTKADQVTNQPCEICRFFFKSEFPEEECQNQTFGIINGRFDVTIFGRKRCYPSLIVKLFRI